MLEELLICARHAFLPCECVTSVNSVCVGGFDSTSVATEVAQRFQVKIFREDRVEIRDY